MTSVITNIDIDERLYLFTKQNNVRINVRYTILSYTVVQCTVENKYKKKSIKENVIVILKTIVINMNYYYRPMSNLWLRNKKKVEENDVELTNYLLEKKHR